MKKRIVSMFSLVVLVASYTSGIVSVYAESMETSKEPIIHESEPGEQLQSEEEPTEITSQKVEVSIDQVQPDNDRELDIYTSDSNISEEKNLETQDTTTEPNELNDDLYSGTFGTSDWRIDSAGVLHIYEGEFPTLMNIFKSPWEQYSEVINTIVFEGPVKAHRSSHQLFAKLNLVTSFVNISYLDVSDVVIMDRMFSEMSSLQELDLSNFDTSNVTDMSGMFSGASSLSELDVSNFKTANVIHMNGMFSRMSSLTKLNLSNFETSKVIGMGSMFLGMDSLTILNLSNFETSNVTDMSYMFSGLNSLTALDLSNFDTSNVTDMSYMFSGLNSLTTLDLSNFDTSNVTNMNSMFSGMNNLRKINLAPNFKFISGTSSLFPEAPSETPYTGKWMNAGEGPLVSQSRKYVFTAAELQTNYEGSSMADAYTWEIDLSGINVHDSTIQVGENWNAADNFDSATDKDGNSVDFEKVNVEGFVDTTKEGEYEVSYRYEEITSVAKITVKAKEATPIINVQDSNIQVGDDWKAADNFISAFDKNGDPLDFSVIKITGEVDTNKIGEYEISYSYEEVTSVAKVSVRAKEVTPIVNVHDSSIQIGESWRTVDNFDNAFDRLGNVVEFEAIIVEGAVDTKKVGIYEVKYSYDGISAVAKITVKGNEKTPDKSYSNHKNSKLKETRKQIFPKTGEKRSMIGTLVGSGLILLIVLYLVKKRKSTLC